ncbi:hypothetical protein CAPTEDRAFT_19080 [Capitella teleta]|uniref:FAM13A-like domain-containing protein n=2 Tax=Capitella teleta TaxID=283909 RepID=R7TIY2_CAPTE|nr:hypothetical protein CAPTEDRAFT_19080 [Capitella teleta]|eukprot:ELT91055.1 hypothetical protein CAPTEDRAFT_19080 [Capitella teleta]
MTREQVHDEKLAVQKALLHFEGIHGRPSTKSEKEMMRPLYDRYRSIKRSLSKPLSPKDKTELQAVPEDGPIEFSPTSAERNDEFMVTKCNITSFDLSKILEENSENIDDKPWNLHELTVPQLINEQQQTRIQKKNLRKILRDFEEQFLQQTGRRVLKEERMPMESEYLEYKQVKAKLKLLDALLSKHDASIP